MLPRRDRLLLLPHSAGHLPADSTHAESIVTHTIELEGFLWTALIAGFFGGGALDVAMWLISRAGLARGNMITALGGLITGSRAKAVKVGVLIHVTSAVVFAAVYTWVMMATGNTMLPGSLAMGLGIGFGHGMIVSLMLVWVVAERHPLEEFREADLMIGLSHLAGHVAFGGVVGLVVGFSPI
jgi:hypothetical protein